jgi:hypothetical protein
MIFFFYLGSSIYIFFQLFDTLKGINIVGSAQLFIINPIGFIINMLAFMAQLFDIYINIVGLYGSTFYSIYVSKVKCK